MFSFFHSTLPAQVLTLHETEFVELNGDFETDSDTDDWPDGWPHPEGASIEEEEGNHFLRLSYRKPDELIGLTRTVEVPSNHHAYFFSCRVRYSNIKMGTEQWHDGRVIFNFRDADGKRVSSPPPPYFKRTSKGWISKHTEFPVPENAVSLDIMLALFKVQSGVLDFDDIYLVPIPAEPVIQRIETREAERLADQERRAALVKPRIEAPAPEAMPPALKVVGNQIVDANGNAVWLHGLSVPSLEWVSNGEHIFESIRTAVTQWHAKVIRLPVNLVFWIGKGPYQKDGGAAYRQHIEDAANLCASLGVHMILDLHQSGLPVDQHYSFWEEAATRLKNHPAVLFELFNTPTFSDWSVWQEDMQKMLDVVRATGAENMVLVDGMTPGQLLAAVRNGSALEDPSGHGVAYSFHLYPENEGEKQDIGKLAETHSIFITELGAWKADSPNAPNNQEWAASIFPWLQAQEIHWAAWCFHPLATPRMLENWDYTPTANWGVYVQDALGDTDDR